MIIVGITEKAGRVINGKLCGDDIVRFKVRACSRVDLLRASLQKMDDPEFIAEGLAQVRQTGGSLVEGARFLDDLRENMERELGEDNGSERYASAPHRIKGSESLVPFFEYAGADPAKEGRLYIRGEVLEQEVLIPAQNKKPDPVKENSVRQRLRDLLPISSYGQFMLKGEDQLSLLRVVAE